MRAFFSGHDSGFVDVASAGIWGDVTGKPTRYPGWSESQQDKAGEAKRRNVWDSSAKTSVMLSWRIGVRTIATS